jgi:hypothetical protein
MHYGAWGNDVPDIRGVKVVGASADGDAAELVLDDGRRIVMYLGADCCSNSYFAEPKQFDELVGRTLASIEMRDGVGVLDPSDNEGDVISPHFLVITTDQGHVTIDWRNSSNGFYDGWVSWHIEGGVQA